MALRGIGLHHEGPAVAELEVGGEDLAPDATDDHALLAPVELVASPGSIVAAHRPWSPPPHYQPSASAG